MKALERGLRRPVAAAIGGLLACGALPVGAQDVRVEVTGSNIRRVEGEGAMKVVLQDGGRDRRVEVMRHGDVDSLPVGSVVA